MSINAPDLALIEDTYEELHRQLHEVYAEYVEVGDQDPYTGSYQYSIEEGYEPHAELVLVSMNLLSQSLSILRRVNLMERVEYKKKSENSSLKKPASGEYPW